jgi:hypothetical protein
MPRGPKGEKRPADVIGAAVMVARIATVESLIFGSRLISSFFVKWRLPRPIWLAIPAGEGPANRDAMGRRRGYCIHRR